MGCFNLIQKKKIWFGPLLLAGVLCAASSGFAQQGPNIGTEHASDFDGEPLDADLDDPLLGNPSNVRTGPQDPLNQTHANQSSQAIDRRNDERYEGLARNPLRQAPRNFRDNRFDERNVRLERQRSQQRGTGNWRRRDDLAFDPLGVRARGFVFYPEIYGGLIATNNLFASKNNEKSDSASELMPSLRVLSDWNRHALSFFATGTVTRWHKFTSENTEEFETRMRGRIDITSRTSVEGGVRYEQNREGRGSVELPDAAARPARTHETEIFAQINHRFNRLGYRLRGEVIRNVFDDVELNSGATQDNHIRDYDETTLELRTNYEFSPRLSLFVDSGIGARKFQTKRDASGQLQGSDDWLLALGTGVELTPKLSFLGRLGYARVTPDDQNLADLEGIIYDGRLIWTPTRLTRLTLAGQTKIEETTQTGSAGSFNRSIGLEMVTSWTHRLTSTVAGEIEVRDFSGPVATDTEASLTFGLEYMFNRSWVLDAGYEFTSVEGTNTFREDAFRLGLKWRR